MLKVVKASSTLDNESDFIENIRNIKIHKKPIKAEDLANFKRISYYNKEFVNKNTLAIEIKEELSLKIIIRLKNGLRVY